MRGSSRANIRKALNGHSRFEVQGLAGEEPNGAGDGVRTRDINLGKVALYQLSYSRVVGYSTFSDEFVAKSIHVIATLDLTGIGCVGKPVHAAPSRRLAFA